MLEWVVYFCCGLGLGLLAFLWQRATIETSRKECKLWRQQSTHLRQKLIEERDTTMNLVEQHSKLEATNKFLATQMNEYQAKSKELEEQLVLQFKTVSNDLFEKKTELFSQKNKEQMDLLLKPLKDKISDFQKQIQHNHQVSQERTVVLKEAFTKVNSLYEKMHNDAQKTTRAIMGDHKLQGTWGEVHALHLLERTGLRKNEQYFVQKRFYNKEGKYNVPDFVIKLPGDRTIVMDVKVSLVNYVKFFNASNEQEKQVYLKKHIQSIKNHIKLLSEKNYTQIYDLRGLDFVMLLLPMEPSFALAVQHEPSLFEEAYTKNIVLVSPTTLQATLSMIEQVWRDHTRNRYAIEIAQAGGALYDKFVGFVENLEKVSHQLMLTQRSCDEAMKKLKVGRGNLVSKVEKLKEMGVRTSKKLLTTDK